MTDDELIAWLENSLQFRSDIHPIDSDRLIALARIGASVMPRPIEEAPKDDLVERLRNPAHIEIWVGKHQTKKETRLDGVALMRDAEEAAARIEALERSKEALKPLDDWYGADHESEITLRREEVGYLLGIHPYPKGWQTRCFD